MLPNRLQSQDAKKGFQYSELRLEGWGEKKKVELKQNANYSPVFDSVLPFNDELHMRRSSRAAEFQSSKQKQQLFY